MDRQLLGPGPYDYVDIFEAPNGEIATKVALLVRSLGHATTETWVATKWDRFVQLAKEARLTRRAVNGGRPAASPANGGIDEHSGKLASFLDEHKIPYKADTHPRSSPPSRPPRRPASPAAPSPGGRRERGRDAPAGRPRRDGARRYAPPPGVPRAKKVRLASEAEFAPAFPTATSGPCRSRVGVRHPGPRGEGADGERGDRLHRGTHRTCPVKMKDFLDAERPTVYDREALLAGTP